MSTNKIAIVTGGGSGIGLAITKKFVQNNIHTIIVGRNDAKLSAAKDMLGDLCEPMICDLSDLSSIPKLINDIVQKHGQIDVLVNNAGINMKKEFTDVTDDDFQRILTTNVTAV
ncbi:MAG TPA: SDR family oxidoreductase, partial [Flavisolibacter sp.]